MRNSESSSGRGVMSRPETPGAGEKVKWTRGAGSLVNLSEAHSTFVLECVSLVRILVVFFFLDMCVDVYLISFILL